MTAQRLTELFHRYLQQQTTPEEEHALWTAWNDPALENVKEQLVETAFDSLPVHFPPAATQSQEIFSRIMEEVRQQQSPPQRIIPIRKWKLWRYAAAAIILLSAGAYFLFNQQEKQADDAITARLGIEYDIAPGGNKAILRLADGRTIVLDSAANGSLAVQGNATIVKLPDGKIAYTTDGAAISEVQYNTMSTPRGGQYRLALPDGTQVWLNAASSITFPTAFAGKERKVTVQGEVYMEVAKKEQQPFIVDVDGKIAVEVLGTHFNINSYADEASIKTTLIEGKVAIKANGKTTLLQPGQQAAAIGGDVSVTSLKQMEITKAIAWKDGRFNFQDANLQEIMRQLARWYDVEVLYEKGVPDLEFFGEIERSLPLSEVLKGLKMSGVHFRLEEGKRLVVLP